MFASLLALAAVCSAPPADGEQVLADLDKKVTAAKTVRIEFEVNQESGGLTNLLASGVVRIDDRNRFRTEIDFHTDGRRGREVTVCDGTTAVRLTGPSPAELKPAGKRAVPPWYTTAVRERLGRGGTFLAVELLAQHATDPKAARPGAEAAIQTDKAVLGPAAEKINDVECWVVDYELTAGGGLTAKARVWVDQKTGLPVRRRLEALGNVFTATHAAFALDEKTDDKLFELPK
jgi:outer membrane lipoprotein-sorting protein